jgi:hypothetical protein
MNQEIFVHIALPLIGVGLIASAIIWQERLGKQEVIDITTDKLGLTLKANSFGLLVLFGFVIIGAGIFFLYKGYESKLDTLQGEKRGLEQVIAGLKAYDLRLNLIFPENDTANPLKVKHSDASAYVRKQGERDVKLYNSAIFDPGDGGILVHFNKLTLGDTLYVIVEQEGKKWRSENMVIPSARLNMKRITD